MGMPGTGQQRVQDAMRQQAPQPNPMTLMQGGGMPGKGGSGPMNPAMPLAMWAAMMQNPPPSAGVSGMVNRMPADPNRMYAGGSPYPDFQGGPGWRNPGIPGMGLGTAVGGTMGLQPGGALRTTPAPDPYMMDKAWR